MIKLITASIRLALVSLAVTTLAQARIEDELPPASAQEPIAQKLSLAKAGAYLDVVSLDWTRNRQCGTCHTNYAYMIARPSIKDDGRSEAIREIRQFFEQRVTHWDDSDKAAKPRWDAEVIATGVTLALNDAATTGKLHDTTRKALDRIWTVQKPNGGFDWLKCNWPPYEHDDYYGAVYAALGVGLAPDGYAQTEKAREGMAKLRKYLNETPAPDLHHKTFLLWASLKTDGLMSESERQKVKESLRALQKPDGGWSLPSLGSWKRHDKSENAKDGQSDGYATGFVVYVLRKSGLPASDPAIQRGLAWLKSNQRTSGRWFTRSLSNDKAHYIANAGTGFAIMAIVACEPGQ